MFDTAYVKFNISSFIVNLIVLETPSPRGDPARTDGHYWLSHENGAGAQRRPVRTAPARSAGAHALKARGIGLAWGEGAPIPAALRADAHCTCCGSTQAFPERSRMMMSGPPLPTLALGRSAKRALHRASRAARSARRLRRPHHQEATRAVGADRARSARRRQLACWRSQHTLGGLCLLANSNNDPSPGPGP